VTDDDGPKVAAPNNAGALAATGAAGALSRVTTGAEDETAPSGEIDGKTLLFQVSTTSQDANGNPSTQSSIVGVDPESGVGRTIFTPPNTQALDPEWMPNGQGFMFSTDSMGSMALVRSLAGAANSSVSVIVGGNLVSNPRAPAVAPDGHHVAFMTQVRGDWSVAVAGIDGTRLTMLGPGYYPSWTADGKRLVFARTVNGHNQLFSCDATSGASLTQITVDASDNSWPHVSPDGRYIVFSSNRGWNTQPNGTAEHTFNLYAVHLDGTALTQLTSGPGESIYPLWGKDGWVYFAADPTGKGGNHDIWRLQPAGDLAGQNVAMSAPPVAPAAVAPIAAPASPAAKKAPPGGPR
jgi:Tol biopolymer transport system component